MKSRAFVGILIILPNIQNLRFSFVYVCVFVCEREREMRKRETKSGQTCGSGARKPYLKVSLNSLSWISPDPVNNKYKSQKGQQMRHMQQCVVVGVRIPNRIKEKRNNFQ